MKANSLFLFALFCPLRAAFSAISVGGFMPAVTFDTLPSSAEWATRSITGDAAGIVSAAEIDAAVQTNQVSQITNALFTEFSSTPMPHGRASWSSVRQSIYTGPAGVAANMILATLQNDTGMNRSAVHISYDFDVVPGGVTPEEIPGQRVYFSLSGAQNSWQVIPQFSGNSNAGLRDSWIQLGSWPPGSLLYLLWVQDNASHSPDACYMIDNFVADFAICDSFYWLQPWADLTVTEGEPARFFLGLCPLERQPMQWFRNNVAIPGATNQTLEFPRAQLGDAGGYHANIEGIGQSRRATLTVLTDTEPPRVTAAYQIEEANASLDTIAVVFSERVQTNQAANPGNYSLRGTASSNSAPSIYEVADITESNVVLHVANLTPGVPYFVTVSNVSDQSAANNLVAPNPTTVEVQTFAAPLIGTNQLWRYSAPPTNTTWFGWMNSSFDDNAWPVGLGAIGFPMDEILPAPFSVQTMILPVSAGGTLTTYFRTYFLLSAAGTNAALLFNGVFDDGAIIYVNGKEVWRVRLPLGTVMNGTLATSAIEPHVLETAHVYAPGLLRETNTVAVEVHQATPASGDVIMGLTMQISRVAPRLTITRGTGNALSLNWTSGGMLQASSILGGPSESWQDIATPANVFSTNVSSGTSFFRVRP